MEHDRVKNVINNVNISEESMMQKVTHLLPPPANILACFLLCLCFHPSVAALPSTWPGRVRL